MFFRSRWWFRLNMGTYQTSEMRTNTRWNSLGPSTLWCCLLPITYGWTVLYVDSLAAPMILRADWRDKRLQAIRPGDKVAALEDRTTISILRNGLQSQRSSQRKKTGIPYGQVIDDKTPSFLIRVSELIDNPVQSQGWVQVRAKHNGMVVIQPELKLFYKQELVWTNGVVEVEPDKMFWLLVANFANQKCQTWKNKLWH